MGKNKTINEYVDDLAVFYKCRYYHLAETRVVEALIIYPNSRKLKKILKLLKIKKAERKIEQKKNAGFTQAVSKYREINKNYIYKNGTLLKKVNGVNKQVITDDEIRGLH